MGELFPVKCFKIGKAYLPTLRQWGHSLTTCNIFKRNYTLNTYPGNQNYLHKYLRYTSCTISSLSQDHLDCFFTRISQQPNIRFSNNFFSWKLRSMSWYEYQLICSRTPFCFANISGPLIAQKWFCVQNVHMDLSFQEKWLEIGYLIAEI